MVSIIVRTKNEERWITSCLKGIYDQSYKDFEVIVVDNKSTDGTLTKAKQYPVKIVTIDEYIPGKSLNDGIRASKGDKLVFLSGHCIPKDKDWLKNLLDGFTSDDIAGVYGRQEPMSFSSSQTKRDLLIVFGLDRKIQIQDPFFHNANAVIRRDIWEKYPFDETVTNIEDRLWASTVQNHGLKIAYEPSASVYHYHGIHHDGDQRRAHTTVKVIEDFADTLINHRPGIHDIEKLNIAAFVPVKGSGPMVGDKKVLEFTLKQAQESEFINDTYVLTDSQETADYARSFGAQVPFIRDEELSKEHVSLDMVYQYSLSRIEEMGIHPDIIVPLWPSYPFRSKGLIDRMISKLLTEGYDSLVPVYSTYNSCWYQKGESHRRIDIGDVPRSIKNPLLMGFNGLGCVTHSEYIRKGVLLGENVGLYKIKDSLAMVEVRANSEYNEKFEELLFEFKQIEQG